MFLKCHTRSGVCLSGPVRAPGPSGSASNSQFPRAHSPEPHWPGPAAPDTHTTHAHTRTHTRAGLYARRRHRPSTTTATAAAAVAATAAAAAVAAAVAAGGDWGIASDRGVGGRRWGLAARGRRGTSTRSGGNGGRTARHRIACRWVGARLSRRDARGRGRVGGGDRQRARGAALGGRRWAVCCGGGGGGEWALAPRAGPSGARAVCVPSSSSSSFDGRLRECCYWQLTWDLTARLEALRTLLLGRGASGRATVGGGGGDVGTTASAVECVLGLCARNVA